MSKKQNAEEDYITTPISVLSYITDLERQLEEAREEIDRLKEQLKHSIKMSDDAVSVIKELRRNQIKEKGDE